jgi:hypothetical protein
MLSSEGSFGINQTKEYYIMSKAINVTYTQFAFGLGKQSRLLRESSHVWHKQYVSADSDDRKSLREQWLTHYVMGNLDVAQPVAERILSKSRDDRTKDQQASYLRASNQFKYHIIRPENSTTSSTTVSKQVDLVEQALALVESLTKAQQAKFFARVSRK